MNANELRTQLHNSGINNATLNFNNSSQGNDSNAGQHQSHQHEQQAHKEYRTIREFENEDSNEDILNSLEIILPKYG